MVSDAYMATVTFLPGLEATTLPLHSCHVTKCLCTKSHKIIAYMQYVTGFEKSRFPCTHVQHQVTLFTIRWYVASCTRSLTIQGSINAECCPDSFCCGLFLRLFRYAQVLRWSLSMVVLNNTDWYEIYGFQFLHFKTCHRKNTREKPIDKMNKDGHSGRVIILLSLHFFVAIYENKGVPTYTTFFWYF